MIRLGALEKAATFFHSEEFEVWDISFEKFRPGFVGRIYPFDRFKTIYHRPTRRETLGVGTDVVLPDSCVVRHCATNEVFMVSKIPHTDADHDVVYDTGVSMHRPSHLLDLVRPTIMGTGDDLGALQDVIVGKMYLDLELRTTERENDAYEKFKGRFFVTMAYGIIAEQGDFLVGDGIDMRLELVYDDGGYQMGRADDVGDEREVVTYRLPLGTGAAYDPATGTYTKGTTADRLFSATVSPVKTEEGDTTTDIQSLDINLYVDFSNIGFVPEPEHEVVYNSIVYHIDSVRSDPESKQWVIKCRRKG